MNARPARRAWWRRSYALGIQIGLIASLCLLLLAFRLEWHPRPDPPRTPPTELVPVTEVPVTILKTKPPPPPRPPVPVAVPDDALLDDDVELRLDDPIEIGEPLLTTKPPLPEEDPPETIEEPPFVRVEHMPEIVGGMAALYAKIQYPDIARRAGIQGRVTLQFVVDREGRVVDPEVFKGVHPLLDEAALEALRQVTFTPGRQRGKAVRVRMSLPVVFKLR